jgi:MoaA/NifB/PqqE/SkfB family radical SAM enzyme
MVKRDRIPEAKMAEIVEDLIALEVGAVTLSGGGEPLLFPYLAATIEGLGRAGVRIGMLSNGSRLKGRVAAAIAPHMTWLRVSIDGWDGPSYARYRGLDADAFGMVIDNLARFAKAAPTCTLGASIIVDADNASHLSGLCRTLRDAGVQQVKVSPCILSDDGTANHAYHGPLAPIVATELARSRELQDGRFVVVDHYHDSDEGYAKAYRRCAMAHLLTVIGADCRVYTGQDKVYTDSGCLGSIRDRRFADFWRSSELKRRLAGLDPSAHCRHHCVADAKNRMLDDFLDLDPAHLPLV